VLTLSSDGFSDKSQQDDAGLTVPGEYTYFSQQAPSLWGVMIIAGRKGEGYRGCSRRGNHMNLGCPSAS